MFPLYIAVASSKYALNKFCINHPLVMLLVTLLLGQCEVSCYQEMSALNEA